MSVYMFLCKHECMYVYVCMNVFMYVLLVYFFVCDECTQSLRVYIHYYVCQHVFIGKYNYIKIC